MSNGGGSGTSDEGTTRWRRSLTAPLRAFVAAESSSAVVLIAAIAVALVWANVSSGSYESFWECRLSLRVGRFDATRDLRTWVNSGLMTFFFFVVGLEARQEFDLGELRDRRRFVLPLIAGLAGMALPVVLYLAVAHDHQDAHAWGIAMSTDTALALGALAMLGRRVPARVRVFLLTVFVVDDVASLLVVTFVYTEHLDVGPLLAGVLVFLVLLAFSRIGIRSGVVYAVIGLVGWFALLASGVDPIVLGLLLGLATSAYTPLREDLERASGLFRGYREQPTPELARSVTASVAASQSPNLRLQNLFVPWTTYVVVPVFALANAGIPLSGSFLTRAYTAPITLGIMLAYVLGKPVAVVTTSWVIEKVTGARVRPDVGWAAVAGSGTIAGIGFTVSFVVAALVLDGRQLAEAKLGVLSAGVLAAALTWAVYAAVARLPTPRRAMLLLGDPDQLLDLAVPVDPRRDHVRGSLEASVTLVEYGDQQCPFCGQAESVVRSLMRDDDLRYVWRHLPLTDVHPEAQAAAEASEAAAEQGRFWEMHDLLMGHQEHLRVPDLLEYAKQIGLDKDRFYDALVTHTQTRRVAEDVESADESGVSGTPTFFINGRRHYGAYDIDSLSQAITLARVRAKIRSRTGRPTDVGVLRVADDDPAAADLADT